VVTLENGFHIKPYLSEKSFDIIILNVETQESKRKIFSSTQESPSTESLLIVLRKSRRLPQEAIQMGVLWFIHKPFKIDEVCTMVDQFDPVMKLWRLIKGND